MYDSLMYTVPIAIAASTACAAAFAARTARKGARHDQPRHDQPRHDERGEGVISAAIAVLIIASLGALMWVGFKTLWENAEETTNSEIAKIGK